MGQEGLTGVDPTDTEASALRPEPEIEVRMSVRDIQGALNGSRLFEQPRYAPEAARWRAFLERPGPRLLEIGFDHGRRLLATARQNPGWSVAGIEVRRRRVHGVQVQAEAAGLTNLLAWRADARTVLANVTPPERLDVIEILFPTPWWDPALRAKRLLITPALLVDVARALRPGGVLLAATDVPDYAASIQAALASAQAPDEGLPLSPDPRAWETRPHCDALSRRERKCAREGLEVWRFAARRA